MSAPISALTIAGSDPSGGAGLQADLKTFHQHGVYGMSVVTLVTVQNTQRVSRVELLPASLVAEQIEAVLQDVPPACIKLGALGGADIVDAVIGALAERRVPLVVDPVMISKHGAALLDADAQARMRALIVGAELVTPNGPEAAALTGREVTSSAQALDAAKAIRDLGAQAVLIKGGHFDEEDASDLLLDESGEEVFSAPRVDTKHTHGTGCTYASAISARLALGHSLRDAVYGAKRWLQRAIVRAPGLGGGQGPVFHHASCAGTFPPFDGH
ncbi:MAG: bifunctional hydroxymethylpyrimidine kinase/phosphomethylpyrimidine kinase [Polyangiales bacterium]